MAKLDKEELHAQILERADEANSGDLDNRAEMLDDLQFKVGGDYQWDQNILIERRADGRPCETINRMPQFIRQVVNDARENRPSIKVRGVDDESDPETAGVLEGIIRHIEEQSEATSTAYIPAIDNAASCGIGYFRIKADYSDDDTFGQDLFVEGVPNPLSVLCDPLAKKATREDARYWFIFEDLPENEFEDRFKDKSKSNFEGMSGFWRDTNSKTVRIAEYWCKEPITKTLGQTQDGKTIDLTNIPAPSVKFLGITQTREAETFKIVQYIVSGTEILEGPNEWAGRYFPIVAVIGEEIYLDGRRIRKSVIRDAKAAQRLYNYWRNAQTEQIALQPLAPYIGTDKQFAAHIPLWKNANRRAYPYLPYTPDGTANPPQRLAPPQASTALTEAILTASEEMKATTGIYDAALGNRSNETSGVAIQNRQKESDVSNAHFADNLALSIRHAGRILIDLIPHYYDTERVVRLLNEDGTEKYEKINTRVMGPDGWEFKNDLSIGKYDVTVKVGPSYATRRQEAADFLMQFMQTMPESAQFVADLLAKNLDAPGADELAERFRTVLKKQHPEFFKDDEEPPPPPTQGDQQNALMMQSEVRKAEAEARKAEAEAEDAESDAALKSIQVAQLAADGGDPLAQAAREAVLNILTDIVRSQNVPGQGAGMSPAPSQPQPA